MAVTVRRATIVCLGALAAQSLPGRDSRIAVIRGEGLRTPWAPQTIATWYPSAVWRAPSGFDRDRLRGELLHDLQPAIEEV